MKLKIVLYSPVFHPEVGGVETVTACLAENFIRLGHECIVITPVKNLSRDNFSYKVVRTSSFREKLTLAKWSDIILSNGASFGMLPAAKLALKPFVWIHVGYQASCIDGLGWVEGEKAPVTPVASIKFHAKRSGWPYALKEAVKLYLRRAACKYLVTMNVAVSDWVAARQPFAKQVRIYNPFPLSRFMKEEVSDGTASDFIYVGRLVSEKGVATLIDAFYYVYRRESETLRLMIIGDGNRRTALEKKVDTLGLSGNVTFAGRKEDEELSKLIQQTRIGVVPSEWEEPMGGVALELLAAGKNVIASRYGGLAECVGEAGVLFDNGDPESLAQAMMALLKNDDLSEKKKMAGKEQVKKFDPVLLTEEYVRLLTSLVKPGR